MKISIAAILLTASFAAIADDGYGYRTLPGLEDALTSPQPMYYNQERLQEIRELEQLQESNDIAREQLQLERRRISDADFQRQIDSHN